MDFALAHPDRVCRLVLMNTYYGNCLHQHLPELIRLLADPTSRRWPTR